MKGYKTINYRKKSPSGVWGDSIEAAPYKHVTKIGLSDAFTPAIALDHLNVLWLAFCARDDYLVYQGINVRPRVNDVWGVEEKATQVFNPAIDPQIISDTVGNLHCVWVDYRVGYAQLRHRARYTAGYFYEETLLTTYVQEAKTGWIKVVIILGCVLGLAIPGLFISLFRRRKKNKIIQERRNI